MYEGTLYGHWEAIVTLQQMLVLCDSAGVIDMTPQAISGKTSIPLDILTKGIEVLSSPDPYSRTPGEDGKRIATIDEHRPWGWYIINHAKYQKLKSAEEKREADRLRMEEKRKANKNSSVAECRKPSQHVAEVAHSDADADVNKNKEKAVAFAPPDWVSPESWKGFEEMRNKHAKTRLTDRARALIVKELETLRDLGNDPNAVLDQSTRNSWADVWPLKGKAATASAPATADGSWLFSDKATQERGRSLGIDPRVGESMDAYRDRLRTAR